MRRAHVQDLVLGVEVAAQVLIGRELGVQGQIARHG
jgi:hypothetical protein